VKTGSDVSKATINVGTTNKRQIEKTKKKGGGRVKGASKKTSSSKGKPKLQEGGWRVPQMGKSPGGKEGQNGVDD